jgi:hypothetical protein
MLNFYMDCGFDDEDDLISYVESLRDSALLDEDDDAVSSLAQDLSASFIEVTEAIEGSSLYLEYVSPEPLNQVQDGEGYSVEATIVSPEIIFWDPGYIEEDEEWDDYFDSIKDLDYFAAGQDIVLISGIDPASSPILSTLVFSNEDFWLDDDTRLSTISVGLPKPGLNMSETDLSENKWVFRLFGKISGLVKANSASEAKTLFAQVLKDSFSFIESDRGTNKFSHHEFANSQEMEIISDESNWLIPIDHVFVNIRR